ncbi:SDR family NAD(P)-dependent oxidoreductase [Notoacmeibacter sp. MSK16QG-6]|uniref:SDR family NAD(P)-dependent oxidoreductase n=1 Tax=Notoacmeibacter sp. MSK16QG-6 TaxID=2957982 RepID=UPI0020A0B8B6|nr:SDR family oxidoreductase [Notoacmeibacter sp. MSK16QG-6]MCP1198336.1 SDR family oxidoreductase [Notoacmeibacter sp. MSK16QG-6]
MRWIDFEGKTVVVTGASGGIGRAVAQSFADLGAKVFLLDRRGTGLDEPAEAIGGIGLECDVTDAAAIETVADRIAQEGGADILVNNAGILKPAPLDELPIADWQAMMAVNLDGCLRLAQIFGAQMMKKTAGSIVNVASISASQPQPFSGAYSPGKAALVMLSRQIAYEWGPKGIRCNVVSPGLVETPLSASFYENGTVRSAREALVPTGRIGQPQDMADAVVFLASHRASYINGQELVIDGGLSQTLMGSVPRPGYSR